MNSGLPSRSHLRKPGDTWLPVAPPRHPGDPVPDLTLSRLLHRACAADLGPLAGSAARIGSDAPRRVALATYVTGVLVAVAVHCGVEDDGLCPLLLNRAGPHAHDVLAAVAADHTRIAPHVVEATELAGALGRDPQPATRLASTLQELDVLLRMHSAEIELRVSPLILRHLTVADHAWLQRQFHQGVPGDRLGFVVPWLGSHATPDERDRLGHEPHQHVRPVERIFRSRFDALRALALGAQTTS